MGLLKNNTGANKSRRKFLGWTAIMVTTAAVLGKFVPNFKTSKRKVKLLTHDGKLVEVDVDKLPVRRKLVKKNELASWVWKNQEL